MVLFNETARKIRPKGRSRSARVSAAQAPRPVRSAAWICGALALASCAQMQVTHYLPSGDGEPRNRSLCTFGMRDELETDLDHGVKIRVWGGDPDTTALSARVQILLPPGQTLRFISTELTLWTQAAGEPTRLHTTGITGACPATATQCQTRYAPTDKLEGGLLEAGGMLKSAEPKTYRLDIALPVTPGEPYTLKLPDFELNGSAKTGPTVRFVKTTTSSPTNLPVCQQ